MKIRVSYTVEVDDELRRAVWFDLHSHEEPRIIKLATRKEMQSFFWHYGQQQIDDVIQALQDHEETWD